MVSNELMYFAHEHKEKLGFPYLVQYGKDTSIMKNIVATFGPADTVKLINAFFKSVESDDFIKQTGASVGILKVKIPQLLLMIREAKVDASLGKL